MPKLSIDTATVKNLNARYVAHKAKQYVAAAKAQRREIQSETDPDLVLRAVQKLHRTVVDPAEQLVLDAEAAAMTLLAAADVLAGTEPPDPTPTDPIVATASDLATAAKQIEIAIPNWDRTPLDELADDLAAAANAMAETATAARKRANIVADESAWATAEAVSKDDSDLIALSGFEVPFEFVDIASATVPNPKARHVDLSTGAVTEIDDPDHATFTDVIRREFRQALRATRNGKDAAANRHKSERRSRTVAEIKTRLSEVWQDA